MNHIDVRKGEIAHKEDNKRARINSGGWRSAKVAAPRRRSERATQAKRGGPDFSID